MQCRGVSPLTSLTARQLRDGQLDSVKLTAKKELFKIENISGFLTYSYEIDLFFNVCVKKYYHNPAYMRPTAGFRPPLKMGGLGL